MHAERVGGGLVGSVQGSGPPALLLHGGPGLSDYLGDLADEIAGAVTVARYQQRGLKPSATDGDRTIEGHVADAVTVLDSLGWERAWMIGHSWGGHLAMHVAVAHPERLAGVVVLDSLGALPDGGAAEMGVSLMRDLTDAERIRVEQSGEREAAGEGTAHESLEVLRILWPHYFADPLTAPPMPDLAMDFEGHLETWASIARHFDLGTLAQGLPLLRTHSLVIHGAASPIPVSEAERTAALIPEAHLRVLPAVGHFPWQERPGSIRTEIESLLASV